MRGGIFVADTQVELGRLLWELRLPLDGELIRKAIAVEYYRQRAASVGCCAQMAGMSEEDFIVYLGERGLSIFQYENEREFLEDLENA